MFLFLLLFHKLVLSYTGRKNYHFMW